MDDNSNWFGFCVSGGLVWLGCEFISPTKGQKIRPHIAERERNPTLRRILLKLHSDVSAKPLPLHNFMAEYPEAFNAEFVFAVKHGARMGRLDAVLKELPRQWPDELRKQREVVHKIIKAVAMESLKDSHDWFYCRSALQALAELGDRDAVTKILPLHSRPHPASAGSSERDTTAVRLHGKMTIRT